MCTMAADGLSLGEGHLLKHLPRYDPGCQGGGGVKGNLCVSQVPAPLSPLHSLLVWLL